MDEGAGCCGWGAAVVVEEGISVAGVLVVLVGSAPETGREGGVVSPLPFISLISFSISAFSSSDIIVVATEVISFMSEISPIYGNTVSMGDIAVRAKIKRNEQRGREGNGNE